jgi:hypothetical protein
LILCIDQLNGSHHELHARSSAFHDSLAAPDM